MLSNLGNLSLWLCLLITAFQALNCIKNNNNSVVKYNNFAVNTLLLFSLISFFSLMYGYVISDFSLTNVYLNSHSTKPLIYKISGVWGNHEGSMLLWILVLTIFNYFIFKLYKKANLNFVSKTLETQALIMLGFILFTILTSNPFDKMATLHKDGLGFNPILQDPALAIHPPLLYIGYVGFSSIFSISISTLSLHNTEKIPWHNYMKPFVISAWTFLTAGIAFGSIWAYYELGWGGWWFWDPVENASFMPWLLGTALLHSLITVEKKKSLRSWVLLLSILTFILSILGTFLVRSGILTSVHTFALDPSRGIYILALVAILGGYSLILFSIKSKNFFENNYFSFLSKESAILINNIIIVVVCASIFLGTIYPLAIEALTNNKISVGEPYFNSAVVPIMFPAIIIMGIGPILSWTKEDGAKILKKILPTLSLTLFITLLFLLFYQSYSLIGIIGILLAFWIIINNLTLLVKKIKNHSMGMLIAHLGVGFIILGITSSSVWQEEKIARMQINDILIIKKYNILLKEVKEISGPNYVAIVGKFIIYDKKKNLITKLEPENRYYPITNNFTTEASIHTNLLRDLYIVLGEGNSNEGWIVRIYNNPLVAWIWIGALFIFLGGIISFKINLKKIKNIEK